MGNTYDMDLKVGRSRGKRKLALVTMGLETNHTISHIYTTYFVLSTKSILRMRSMQVFAQCLGYTYDMDLGFVVRGVNGNYHW